MEVRLARTGQGRGIESEPAQVQARRSATPGPGQTHRRAHHPAADIARPQTSISHRNTAAPSARFSTLTDRYRAVQIPPGFQSNNPYHRRFFREHYGFGYTEWLAWYGASRRTGG